MKYLIEYGDLMVNGLQKICRINGVAVLMEWGRIS